MSTVQEFTLADKQATVAGVTKLINRHLRGQPLRRVEVRFSTHAGQPFDPNAAMQQIKGLLREHGLSAVEVSVRALELAIDDAAGEHRVRLLHKDEAQPSPAAGSFGSRLGERTGGRFSGLLARLVPGRRASAPMAGHGATQLTQVPVPQPQPKAPQPPAEPAVPQKRAVELLKQALAVAVRDEGPTLGDVAVQSLRITVRLASLHQALSPLVARDAVGAGQWATRLLAEHQIAAGPGLRVAYDYKPPQAGAGGDLEIGRAHV